MTSVEALTRGLAKPRLARELGRLGQMPNWIEAGGDLFVACSNAITMHEAVDGLLAKVDERTAEVWRALASQDQGEVGGFCTLAEELRTYETKHLVSPKSGVEWMFRAGTEVVRFEKMFVQDLVTVPTGSRDPHAVSLIEQRSEVGRILRWWL